MKNVHDFLPNVLKQIKKRLPKTLEKLASETESSGAYSYIEDFQLATVDYLTDNTGFLEMVDFFLHIVARKIPESPTTVCSVLVKLLGEMDTLIRVEPSTALRPGIIVRVEVPIDLLISNTEKVQDQIESWLTSEGGQRIKAEVNQFIHHGFPRGRRKRQADRELDDYLDRQFTGRGQPGDAPPIDISLVRVLWRAIKKKYGKHR